MIIVVAELSADSSVSFIEGMIHRIVIVELPECWQTLSLPQARLIQSTYRRLGSRLIMSIEYFFEVDAVSVC